MTEEVRSDSEALWSLIKWLEDPQSHLEGDARRDVIEHLTNSYVRDRLREAELLALREKRGSRVREGMLYGGAIAMLLTLIINSDRAWKIIEGIVFNAN